MRELARTISMLLAALLLLTLLLMILLQSAWFKDQAAAYISHQIGREVTFAGPHSIDWSLQPLLRLNDVRVANAPWAEPQTMASAAADELSVDLPQFIRGDICFPTLSLESPRVHLARAEDEQAN